MSFRKGDYYEYLEVDQDELNEYATDLDAEEETVEAEQYSKYYGQECKIIEVVTDWFVLVQFSNGRTYYLYDMQLRFVRDKQSHFPVWF